MIDQSNSVHALVIPNVGIPSDLKDSIRILLKIETLISHDSVMWCNGDCIISKVSILGIYQRAFLKEGMRQIEVTYWREQHKKSMGSNIQVHAGFRTKVTASALIDFFHV